MSEKKPKQEFQSSIERYDKKVTVEVGRKAFVFSYLNTMLFEHPEQYTQFDHAYRVNDGGQTGVYWMRADSPELWDTLVKHDFPRKFMPFPTTEDEAIILPKLTKDVYSGLEELLGGNDD